MTSDENVPSEDSFEQNASEEFVTISRAELEMLKSRSRIVGDDGLGELSQTMAGQARNISGPPLHDSLPDTFSKKESDERDQRVASLEKMCKEAVRDRELATMLAGKPLVPGAAAQLIKLWRDEFDVYEEDGHFKIAARDGRKPSQVVSEWLTSSDYSHFCLPSSRGGTGARDANRPVSTVQMPDPPKNLGEAIVMKWKEESVSRGNGIVKSIGLKRHR